MFSGFDWFGSLLEVREDRFVNMPFRGGFRGGLRGGFMPRGGFGGGGFRGGYGGIRGGFGMGYMGGGGGMGLGRGGGPPQGGGRNFTNDLYADYSGPDSQANGGGMPVDGAGSGLKPEPAEPNQQILVRNVSLSKLSLA